MEKKQTAIHWIIEALSLHLTDVQKVQFEGLFQQAIGMEKEQMEASYSEGLKRMSYIRSLVDGLMVPDDNPVPDDFETFYKNKYGDNQTSND